MVSTVETVECVICHKTHLELPPARDGVLNKEGATVFGRDARDWTYYREWYQNAYVVVCKKEHDAMLAPKGEVVK